MKSPFISTGEFWAVVMISRGGVDVLASTLSGTRSRAIQKWKSGYSPKNISVDGLWRKYRDAGRLKCVRVGTFVTAEDVE